MLSRRTTVSRYGVFQFSPGPATRANFPSLCTIATCAVSTVKNDPSTMLNASRAIRATKNKKAEATFTLLFDSVRTQLRAQGNLENAAFYLINAYSPLT